MVPVVSALIPSIAFPLAILRRISVSVAPALTTMPSYTLLFATLREMTLRSDVSGLSSDVTQMAGPRPPTTTFPSTVLSSEPSSRMPKPPVSGSPKKPLRLTILPRISVWRARPSVIPSPLSVMRFSLTRLPVPSSAPIAPPRLCDTRFLAKSLWSLPAELAMPWSLPAITFFSARL